MNEITNTLGDSSSSAAAATAVSPEEPLVVVASCETAAAAPVVVRRTTENDLRVILDSLMPAQSPSLDTVRHGMRQLAQYCLDGDSDKERLLRAVTRLDFVGDAMTSAAHSDDDECAAAEIQYAGCVLVACVAVCARYQHLIRVLNRDTVHAVLTALTASSTSSTTTHHTTSASSHHDDYGDETRRFALAAVSRIVKHAEYAALAVEQFALGDWIVATLQQQPDSDPWWTLWACQALHRLARRFGHDAVQHHHPRERGGTGLAGCHSALQ